MVEVGWPALLDGHVEVVVALQVIENRSDVPSAREGFGPEARWYRVGAGEEIGPHQILVADSDEHLIRFAERSARRPVAIAG